MAADAVSRTLINEVWEVVDQNYLDARGTGWEASRWASLRDGALERKQYASISQVRKRTIREPVEPPLPFESGRLD